MHEVAQEHLRKNVKLAEEGSGQIRIFEIQNGRLQKFFSGSELVREVPDSTDLFAEVRFAFLWLGGWIGNREADACFLVVV